MGEEGSGRSCGITRDLQKLKQQAMAYYQENDVPRRLEELLNSTFYLQPADVYGHLVGTCGRLPSFPLPSGPRCGSALRLRRGVAPARCWGRAVSDPSLEDAEREAGIRYPGGPKVEAQKRESRGTRGGPVAWEAVPSLRASLRFREPARLWFSKIQT